MKFYIYIVTAFRMVVVFQSDIGIDSNQTGGIKKIKYRRRQQVIEWTLLLLSKLLREGQVL